MSERDFNADLTRAAQAVNELIAALDWDRFHTPSRLSRSIMLEAAELEQEFVWLSEDEADALLRDRQRRDRLVGELADITINLLALAAEIDVDLNAAVEAKSVELRERYEVKGTRTGRARHEVRSE
ncbi:MAG TPA: MazG-like family protein [Solirubrobacterales bacterium]|nr:MazG-like family protein [Solirubrobacterales bacterium]